MLTIAAGVFVILFIWGLASIAIGVHIDTYKDNYDEYEQQALQRAEQRANRGVILERITRFDNK